MYTCTAPALYTEHNGVHNSLRQNHCRPRDCCIAFLCCGRGGASVAVRQVGSGLIFVLWRKTQLVGKPRWWHLWQLPTCIRRMVTSCCSTHCACKSAMLVLVSANTTTQPLVAFGKHCWLLANNNNQLMGIDDTFSHAA